MKNEHTPGPWRIDGLSLIHGPDLTRGGQHVVIAKTIHNAEANARLIASAPDYAEACGLALDAGENENCGPLSWLRSAIDTLKEDAVREAASGDDPDAYWFMLGEVETLLSRLTAASNKARKAA